MTPKTGLSQGQSLNTSAGINVNTTRPRIQQSVRPLDHQCQSEVTTCRQQIETRVPCDAHTHMPLSNGNGVASRFMSAAILLPFLAILFLCLAVRDRQRPTSPLKPECLSSLACIEVHKNKLLILANNHAVALVSKQSHLEWEAGSSKLPRSRRQSCQPNSLQN